MSRPPKSGLDYFLSDIGFWDDGKIMDLANEYGPVGVCVYDVIVRQVYKNGYYLETSLNALASLVVRTVGNRWIRKKDLVLQVIHYCGEIGLFDKALLSKSVITSVGIQQRYSQVTARNRVNKDKYWLLEKKDSQAALKSASPEGVSAAKTPVSVTETTVNAEDIRQRREEKKREEKSRVCADFSIPCKNGTYFISKEEHDQLTHTYPDMNIDLSVSKMHDYLTSHPEKRGFMNGARSYIEMWLREDDQNGKYRKPKQQGVYDLSDYESFSVIDEMDDPDFDYKVR